MPFFFLFYAQLEVLTDFQWWHKGQYPKARLQGFRCQVSEISQQITENRGQTINKVELPSTRLSSSQAMAAKNQPASLASQHPSFKPMTYELSAMS
jgi:hypothetical protein